MIMAETGQRLDLDKPANDAIALLRANFPDSESFDEEGKFQSSLPETERRSLLSVVTFGLLGD